MKSNRHIVWLTPGFATSEEDDYTTPTLQNLAIELKKNSPEVKLTIVAIHFPYNRGQYDWNGITVHSVGGANCGYPKRFLVWSRVIKIISEINILESVDLIHSFWYSEAAVLADKLHRKLGIPHMCTIMGQDALTGNRYMKLLRKKSIFKVGISERSALAFENSSSLSTDAIIPFGIDTIEVAELQDRTIDIIGVGTLTLVKRFDRFLEVIDKLAAVTPNLNVMLVGDGPEFETLKSMISTTKLESCVTLTGLLRRKEVLLLMSKSKILLHTAESEGMGYVFLEAAACGCYVASTPVGIIHEDAYTFVSDSVDELSKQLGIWLNKPLHFQQRVKQSSKDTAVNYADLYEKLSER